jgi:hypothetical protein
MRCAMPGWVPIGRRSAPQLGPFSTPIPSGCCQKGGSGAERDHREALGRSRGGYGTKACVIADGRGRALAFRLASGQAHERPHALPLLDRPPGVPQWVTAATPATVFARRSGPPARGQRSRPRPTRHRCPALSGSRPTATSSSGCGSASRSGGPSPPATKRPPSASGRPLSVWPPLSIGSSDDRP